MLKTACCRGVVMQCPVRTPVLCAGRCRCLGCREVHMLQKFEVVKRAMIVTFFVVAAAWLVWRGNSYNDINYSLVPAVMCALESLVLVMTGIALARRRRESD